MNDFYVYVLFREDKTTPFYVGKGRGDRVNAHARPSEICRERNSIKTKILRRVVGALGYVPRQIIFSGLLECEALAAEAGLIASLGRLDNGSGILANMTDGGEGASGNVQSPADREKKRAAAMRPETRARKSAALLETFSNPKVRAKLSAAQARIRTNARVSAKLDSIRAEAFSRPDVQERRKAAVTAALRKPEVRQKLANAQANRWSDPAQRAKQAEAAKTAWARRRMAAACA